MAVGVDKDFSECIESVLLNWGRTNEAFVRRVVQLRGLAAFEQEFPACGAVPWWTLLRQVVAGLEELQKDFEYGRGVLQKGFEAATGDEFDGIPF